MLLVRLLCFLALAAGLATAAIACSAEISSRPQTEPSASQSKIAPYVARFGRPQPVVAFIGENSGTELTDFVIPYGVLAEAGGMELVTVATRPGVLRMRPALQLQPEATVREFDARFPEGADYVIVPAVVRSADSVLVRWVAAQGHKGATVVSICDGALVVANSGLLRGHRATAHWATEGLREKRYPDTEWVPNTRYVADGKLVSSAGISAAMPTALALVEAIAGYARASAVAHTLGVADWSPRHNSDAFHPHFGVNLWAFAKTQLLNGWLHTPDRVGVPVAPGVDEVALALTADAYSRTGRSRAYSLAASARPIRTRHGLMLVPDQVPSSPQPKGYVLPAVGAMAWEALVDSVLAGISQRYGRATGFGVALDFEYPGFKL